MPRRPSQDSDNRHSVEQARERRKIPAQHQEQGGCQNHRPRADPRRCGANAGERDGHRAHDDDAGARVQLRIQRRHRQSQGRSEKRMERVHDVERVVGAHVGRELPREVLGRRELQRRHEHRRHEARGSADEGAKAALEPRPRRCREEDGSRQIHGELHRAAQWHHREREHRAEERQPPAPLRRAVEEQEHERRPGTGAHVHRVGAMPEHEAGVGVGERPEQRAEPPDAKALHIEVRACLGSEVVEHQISRVHDDRRPKEEEELR